MKEGNNFDNSIFVRFLMDEASKEDVLLLENWISSDIENKNYFNQIRDTWNSVELNKELDEKKIKADLKSVMDRIEGNSNGNMIHESKSRFINKAWLLKAAAIFIIGFAISWIVFNGASSIETFETVYSTVETPKGSSTVINLPDGSTIWLNAESKLKYPLDFSHGEREVYLEGEAFFDVAKDKKRQFFVKTSDLTVKVFGTSFNVKSYPGDNTVETTLVEGLITIQKKSDGKIVGKEIKMESNQRIVLYKKQDIITPTETQLIKIENVPPRKAKLVLSKRIDPKRFTSWKDGQLIIKSKPMIKLAVTLERRYNVKIHFEDEEIKQFKFTGTIENETIEQVMAAIKLASSIDYRIEEREIWIRKRER